MNRCLCVKVVFVVSKPNAFSGFCAASLENLNSPLFHWPLVVLIKTQQIGERPRPIGGGCDDQLFELDRGQAKQIRTEFSVDCDLVAVPSKTGHSIDVLLISVVRDQVLHFACHILHAQFLGFLTNRLVQLHQIDVAQRQIVSGMETPKSNVLGVQPGEHLEQLLRVQ